jgi:hypothetical protein
MILASRDLFRPAAPPGVGAVPDPIDIFTEALADATRERGLADLSLTPGVPTR